MLPSTGLFRNIPCPYFEEGECTRPFCHFKHNPRKGGLSNFVILRRDSTHGFPFSRGDQQANLCSNTNSSLQVIAEGRGIGPEEASIGILADCGFPASGDLQAQCDSEKQLLRPHRNRTNNLRIFSHLHSN
jgi:hypothetical protein